LGKGVQDKGKLRREEEKPDCLEAVKNTLKVETYICSSLAQTVYLRPKYL
jgi:hypothetical protein